MVTHEITVSMADKDCNLLKETEMLLDKNLFERTTEKDTWMYVSDIGQFVASVRYTFTANDITFEISAIDSSVLTDVMGLINKLKDKE